MPATPAIVPAATHIGATAEQQLAAPRASCRAVPSSSGASPCFFASPPDASNSTFVAHTLQMWLAELTPTPTAGRKASFAAALAAASAAPTAAKKAAAFTDVALAKEPDSAALRALRQLVALLLSHCALDGPTPDDRVLDGGGPPFPPNAAAAMHAAQQPPAPRGGEHRRGSHVRDGFHPPQSRILPQPVSSPVAASIPNAANALVRDPGALVAVAAGANDRKDSGHVAAASPAGAVGAFALWHVLRARRPPAAGTVDAVRVPPNGPVDELVASLRSFSSSLAASLSADDPLRFLSITETAHVDADGGESGDGAGDLSDGSGTLNQYVVFHALGKGAQGEVFLAMDTTTDELRAIKAVQRPSNANAAFSPTSRAARERYAAVAREVAIMKRLRHRNVVALHEVIDDPAQDTMYLVMQYVEHGPLATMREDGTASRTIAPELLVSYARQVCAGLHYLHRHGVIHRDVKPENILLGANDAVFLADFGISEAFDVAAGDGGTATRGRSRVSGTRGTVAFLAPELLEDRSSDVETNAAVNDSDDTPCSGDGDTRTLLPEALWTRRPGDVDGEPVDVWALGITLHALLYGKLPWEFTDARDLFEAIQRRPIELRPLAPSMSDSAGSVRRRPTPPPAGDPATAGSVRGGRMRTELSIDSSGSAAVDPSLSASATAYVALRGPLSMSTNSLPTTTPASIDAAWRRVLSGMLQRDPAKRSSVGRVRRQLAAMAHDLEHPATAATVDGAALENAITSRK